MIQQTSPDGQLAPTFDYAALPDENRLAVQASAERIRTLVRRTVEDIVTIGKDLIAAKAMLGHGNWLPWLEAEFGWTDRQARNFISVAEAFKSENFSNLDIAPSALYLLARDSTPDEVRQAAVARAEAGEKITHAEAKRMVEAEKRFEAPPEKPAQTSSGLARLLSLPIEKRADLCKQWFDIFAGEVVILDTAGWEVGTIASELGMTEDDVSAVLDPCIRAYDFDGTTGIDALFRDAVLERIHLATWHAYWCAAKYAAEREGFPELIPALKALADQHARKYERLKDALPTLMEIFDDEMSSGVFSLVVAEFRNAMGVERTGPQGLRGGNWLACVEEAAFEVAEPAGAPA